MDEGLHYCRSRAQKFEQANQNKVKDKLLSYTPPPLFIALNLCNPKCFFLITSKVIMFQESLQFQETITFYYSKQIGPMVIGHVFLAHMTYITNYSKHFVSCCCYLHLKPIQGHQLLSDALNAPISMSLKLSEKMNHSPLSNASIYDDEYRLIIQLNYLRRTLKKGVGD